MTQAEDLFEKSKINEWKYIFLVSNPITVFISKMLIEKFNLDKDNIHVFSLRNTDASLISKNFTKIFPKKTDSLLDKIFWDSLTGKRILKKIPSKKYILFTEWAYREAEKIISHNDCVSHVYIEMGQHSYLNIPQFSPKELSIKDKFMKNWKNRLSPVDELAHYYFRDDAFLFVGMMEDVFPMISEDKKLILDNYLSLKKFYRPKLLGSKIIGLTCASRRIERNNWEDMINKLLDNLPQGSLIKVHPSFYANEKIFNDFKNIFNKVSKGNYHLCPNQVILELEILFEKKVFYGSKTALSKYANFMGSKFNLVTLY